jgi:hypothetical protein
MKLSKTFILAATTLFFIGFTITNTEAREYSTSESVTNTPPTASAGFDKSVTLPTNSVTLTGTASDTDGSVASVEWRQVSGSANTVLSGITSKTLAVSNLTEGIYSFVFTVTDNDGGTHSDVAQIMVSATTPTNIIPKVFVKYDKAITLSANSATLTGTASDTDGHIASVAWKQVSGPSVATLFGETSETLTASRLIKEGTYVFILTATDNEGDTRSDVAQIVVSAEPEEYSQQAFLSSNDDESVTNTPPTASAGFDKWVTLPTNSATLTGTASDTDGKIASVKWNQFAGSSDATLLGITSKTLSVSNLTEGTYSFSFVVTDNKGSLVFDTAKIVVSEDVAKTTQQLREELKQLIEMLTKLLIERGVDPSLYI